MSFLQTLLGKDDAPRIERVRYEVRRRSLQVLEVQRLTPHMLRVILAGPELRGFESRAPDDHIKIFVDAADGRTVMRDYTPRRYDPVAGILVLDFVDHEGGPAADWARAAKPGDRLEIGGPRGSQVISGTVDHWLLIGDETALPAIGRRIEELPSGSRVDTVVAIPGAEDEQHLVTRAEHRSHWVHRPLHDADQASRLIEVLGGIELTGRSFVWVGAEAHVARAVRQYLIHERKLSPAWIKAAGYWSKGRVDAPVKDLDTIG
ncbi:siderophore-interacting protein [Frateuria aurantia]